MAKIGRPSTKQEVACTACGTTIYKHPGDIARNRTGRFFCSRECRNKIGSKPKTGSFQQCEQCGKNYWVRPSQEGTARFCSRECKDKAWKVGTEDRICDRCGNTFVFNLKMAKWNTGRYCTQACMHEHRAILSVGKTKITKDGYVVVRQPDHPDAQSSGWIMQHRLVLEEKIGRRLLPHENVHHKNGVKDDNNPDNLELWVKYQPPGQRVDDIIQWCVANLQMYAPELLR